jgi:SepF-like predicted cell division protein (DUF552 family)
MKKFFASIKEKMGYVPEEDLDTLEDEYVELSTEAHASGDSKITVRPFNLEDFDGVKEVLDIIREGNTIAIINIKNLKDKDMVELKRAISKLKKTCDAIKGDIAGLGEDYIVVVPSFAEIYRPSAAKPKDSVEQVE